MVYSEAYLADTIGLLLGLNERFWQQKKLLNVDTFPD